MHYDESLPASGQPMAGSTTNPGIKLPAPALARSLGASPGGVPPMFTARGDAPSFPNGSPSRAQDR